MTLQDTIVPSSIWFFVWASPSFLCCFWGMEIMQMVMGTLKKKCWHLPSSLPPKYTHSTHIIQHALSLSLSFWPRVEALSLLAVSQANFNNCSHIACVPSFHVSVLACLTQNGQEKQRVTNFGSPNFWNKSLKCIWGEIKFSWGATRRSTAQLWL